MLVIHTAEKRDQAPAAPRPSHPTAIRPSVEHSVKSWPHLFEAVSTGAKKHEMRKATDRDYRVGDMLRLREFDPQSQTYSGRELLVRITYVTSAEMQCALSSEALHPDYCILSIVKVD